MKKNYILYFILGTLLSISLNKLHVNAGVGDIYTQDFSNLESVNDDFSAYYLYTMGGQSEEIPIESDASSNTHWYLENNTIKRKSLNDDINLSLGTNSFAILTLETQTYVNFELTVDYKNGGDTYFWPVVAFRQSEKGKYFLEDGAGVFVQNEGIITLWGGDGVGGPFESPKIPGYTQSANEWHTLKIVLNGINLDVYLDDMTEISYSRTLSSRFFKEGYISLISVNNSSSFRNLRITELPILPISDKPNQDLIPDADTDDSLNNIGTKVNEIDELEGLEQNNESNEEKRGCTSSAYISFLTFLPLLFIFFRVRRTR
jgi:hypothetical protein